MLLGSIEAGGTKFVCAVGDENFQIIDQIVIPTTTPAETLSKVVAYLQKFEIGALGVASFGPIEINPNSEKYGYITNTPKANWKDTDVIGYLKKYFDIPMAWTTDVNGSAYGEYVMAVKAGGNLNSLVYYTVGTGVGGGAVINGEFLGGAGHPEMGHVFVKRHPKDVHFDGICPFHGDCLEGLVAGPTFEARLNQKGETVSLDHPTWDILAYYLAQAVMQTTLMIRPEKIVFGGSVVGDELLNKIKTEFASMMNDYVEIDDLDAYLRRPSIENNGSATVGNFALALDLLK